MGTGDTMATARITKTAVDGLTAESFLWDDKLAGFGVRVTAAGAKSYIYQYRLGGREAPKKRMTIGRHGSPWTPDTARKQAERLAHMVGQGIDPALAAKERRRESVTLAFGKYAEGFIDDYLKEQWPGGWDLAAGILRRDAIPFFGSTPLKSITRGRISEFLDSLADRPAVRRNAFAVLRRMYRWAVNRGDVEHSPLAMMDAPPSPASRERVLSDGELRQVWEAAGTLGYPFEGMFRLLIATGQRREEVSGLPWSELDRKTATWTLPAARAKNNQTHLVPLSPLAIETIDTIAMALNPPDDGKELEWPSKGFVLTTTGETAVSGYSKAKLRLDKAIAKAEAAAALKADRDPVPVEGWRVHDLRRTVATGLQRLGVRFEVTEAVLNHVSGAKSGVAGVYQRHNWKAEKRTALDAWGRHVTGLLVPVDTGNVVSLNMGERAA